MAEPRREQELGHGVVARLVERSEQWVDDGAPKYVGAILERSGLHEDGSKCSGVIFWWHPTEREKWELVSLDPLHVMPSVQCAHAGCDFHGFIREGKWEPA